MLNILDNFGLVTGAMKVTASLRHKNGVPTLWQGRQVTPVIQGTHAS